MKINLNSDHSRRLAVDEIKRAAAGSTVEIKPKEETRSLDQNALMWKWNTIIANELGETKEAVHERHKEKHLLPILERDDEGFADMMSALRDVYLSGMASEARVLHKRIVSLATTSAATKKQLTEFLDEVFKSAIDLGIRLPKPGEV